MSEYVDLPRRRRRSIVIIVVSLAVLCVLTAGGFAAWKYLGIGPGHTEKQDDTYTEPVSALTMDISGGNIEVIGDPDAEEVTVERTLKWHNTKPVSHESITDGMLTVKQTECENNCYIDYRITVPADATLDDVRTAAGDVTVNGTTGPATVASNAGNISVTGGTGKVSATSDAGDIEVADTDAEQVTATSAAGDVSVKCAVAPTDVHAGSDAGDVDVVVPDDGQSYSVDAGSDVGDADVTVQQSDEDGHRIEADSSAGTVTIRYR